MEVRGNKHCIAVTGGKACPGYKHRNSDYCYPHDPAISRRQRQANAVKGGHAGLGKRRFNLKSPKSAHRCINLTLNGIFNRMREPNDPAMELKLTKALIALVRVWVRTYDLRKLLDKTA